MSSKSKIVEKTNFSKSSKQHLVWKVKSHIDTPTVPKVTVVPTTSEKSGPKKVIPNPQVIEYDYWIDEKTLTFCLFPKNLKNTTQKHKVVPKSPSKSKARVYVPKSNSEPKNSITH